MAQLSDDCFAFGGGLMSLDDAVRLIAERLDCAVQAERVAAMEADGRILACAIASPLDLPPFDNSAVDGYAVRHPDLDPEVETVMEVAGRGAAGHPVGVARPGAAYRIFTGARMPEGFDTVFMQEDVRRDGERAILPPGLAPGANRRRAGEDLARGDPALPAGRRLGPADLALIGALGLGSIEVRRPLRVALFSTGDEIAARPDASDGPGRSHDANRPMLAALLRRLGARVTDGGILPDRRDTVAEALRAAAGHDLILTSGGVSTGEEDHVKDAVAATGSLTFWRIGIKPGRPVAMGIVAGTPFVGLPGNPVAAFVTFAFVARPLVARLAGEVYAPPCPVPIRSGFAHAKKAGRREFVRVRLARDPAGTVTALKHPREGAGIITSLTQSDGLAVLDEDATRLAPGDPVAFVPFASLV